MTALIDQSCIPLARHMYDVWRRAPVLLRAIALLLAAATAAIHPARAAQPGRPGTLDWQWQAQSLDRRQYVAWDHGLDGRGQIITVAAGGLDPDHCAFADPDADISAVETPHATTHRKIAGYWNVNFDLDQLPNDWDQTWSSTAMAGAAAGAPLRGSTVITPPAATPDTLPPGPGAGPGEDLAFAGYGLAHAARLFIEDLHDLGRDGPFAQCGGSQFGVTFGYTDLLERAAQIGSAVAVIGCWGNPTIVDGRYTARSQDVDRFAWLNPSFVVCAPAGNRSVNSHARLGDPATAKNCIAVAALGTLDQAGKRVPFSAPGPTCDDGRCTVGRVRPTFALPGDRLLLPIGDGDPYSANCDAEQASGTELAAGLAAAQAAIVRQYFLEGYAPWGHPLPIHAREPSAALVRAALLAGTVTVAGMEARPDPALGWGMPVLDQALWFAPDSGGTPLPADESIIALDTQFPEHPPSDLRDFVLDVVGLRNNGQMRVALAWTDRVSFLPEDPALFYDLDLAVIETGTSPLAVAVGNRFAGLEHSELQRLSREFEWPDRTDTVNTEELIVLPVRRGPQYQLRVRWRPGPAWIQAGFPPPPAFGLVIRGDVDLPATSDPDGDTLTHADEAKHRTDPFAPDTDRDGHTDAAEVAAASDPLDPTSVPEPVVIDPPVIAEWRSHPIRPGFTLSWPARKGLAYAVEYCGHLAATDDPDWKPVGPPLIPDANAPLDVEITPDQLRGHQGFFRVTARPAAELMGD